MNATFDFMAFSPPPVPLYAFQQGDCDAKQMQLLWKDMDESILDPSFDIFESQQYRTGHTIGEVGPKVLAIDELFGESVDQPVEDNSFLLATNFSFC